MTESIWKRLDMVPNVDMNIRLTPTPPLKKERRGKKKKKKRKGGRGGEKCRGEREEKKRSVKEKSGWTTWGETTRGSGKRKRRGFWRRGRRSDGFCLHYLGCLLRLHISANHSAYYSESSRDGSSNLDSGATSSTSSSPAEEHRPPVSIALCFAIASQWPLHAP